MSRNTSRAATGLVAAAALIAAVTLVSRIVGFGRTVALGQTLGNSCLGSAYASANAVPNLVFEVVVGGALAGAVVPLLAGAVTRGDKETVTATTRALTGWVLLLLVPAAIICAVFAEPIVGLVLGSGAGCDESQLHEVASSMLRVFAIQIPIYGLTVVTQGTLNAHRRFLSPALAPLLSSLVVIGAYLAYANDAGAEQGSLTALSSTGFALLAWGTTLGVLVLLVTQVPALGRLRLLALWPKLRFPQGVGARARRLAAAGFATVSAQWVAFVVLLRLANQHAEAGASLIVTLMWTVFLLPWAVLAYPIATSTFPQLSSQFEQGEEEEFAATTAQTLRAVVVAGALGSAGVAATAGPVSDLMLAGAPGADATGVLAAALVAISAGVFGYAVLNQAARVFFARHRGSDASWLVAGGWFMAVVLATVTATSSDRADVLPWLAASVSVGLLIAAIASLVQVRRIVGRRAVVGLGRSLVGVLVAVVIATALGTAVADLLSNWWQDANSGWQLALLDAVLTSAVVVASFGGTMLVLDGDDLRALLARLRHRERAN
ncbi:MAG TPA: lipid II flippase MurJ [Actinomycetes bacterium]|nr:lipid II flippase MurJ [Actinomycetes bacterium]